MAVGSTIEWTDATWNPVTGCTKVSAGCAHCYAERMARRLQAMGQPNYAAGFAPTTHERMLDLPFRWARPRRIFVNSMSDLFHEDVPIRFVQRVFETMASADWHCYQVLTKRPQRALELSSRLPWPDNVCLGTTVESAPYRGRIDLLRATPAAIRFLSLEPLLGPLPGLDLSGIDWVIAGGESGPGARPMHAEWARDIRDQCVRAGISFFFKQWGGTRKRRRGRELDGRTWEQVPASVSALLRAEPGAPAHHTAGSGDR